MEANAIEDISIALGLYRPFANESNRAFTSLETWQQLSALLVTQPLRIKPLGYYRTPHSVDIYVFECIMSDTSGSRRYSWKIYRRYRQFQKYVSHSAELKANRLVQIPRLSQGLVKIFHECNCKTRLVELTNWLEAVVEKTQDYYSQLKRRQEAQDRDKLCALQQRSMAQMVGEKTANMQVKAHLTAKSPIVPSTSTLKKLSGKSPIIQIRQSSRYGSLKAIEEQGDPALYVLRADNSEALPVMMLSSFLLAGANCPFPHVFKGMPMFALSLNERNVQLEREARSAYPSRIKNSTRTRAGLGLRLTPSQLQDGQYLGATVAGFLRNKNELDPALADIPVGARLVRVNGIDVNDVPFDQVLIQLRRLGASSLRLRFVYDQNIDRQGINAATSHSNANATSAVEPLSREESRDRDDRKENCKECTTLGHVDIREVSMDSACRCFSADTSRSKLGLLGFVLGDLFGWGSKVKTASNLKRSADPDDISKFSKRRGSTADITLRSGNSSLWIVDKPVLRSWAEISEKSHDVILRGFYSPLPGTMRQDLRFRNCTAIKENKFISKHDQSDSCNGENNKWVDRSNALTDCEAQGVWSTASGSMGLLFGACRIHNEEAAMLKLPPVYFSTKSEHRVSGEGLGMGYILTAINNESTFGISFAAVMKRLRSASRPTSLYFRWYEDSGPYLDTNLAEKHESSLNLSRGSSKSHTRAPEAFESYLDCMAEAQNDLSNSLQLALMENASLRDELDVLLGAHCKLRLAYERAAQREHILQAKIEQSNDVIAKLNEYVDVQKQEIKSLHCRAHEAETMLALKKREFKVMVEEARDSARIRLAKHEEQLVQESNRSIKNANKLAKRRVQKMLETAANEIQRKHEEYLQRLAEEHSDELECLAQQVAVWRHQVEVLTEAERRNYAALLSKGVNPYGGHQRSRCSYSSADSSFVYPMSEGINSNYASQSTQGSTQVLSVDDTVRDCSPEDDSIKNVCEPATYTPNKAFDGNTGTFWDRMASLLSTG